MKIQKNKKNAGIIASAELLFISTILVFGLVTGLAAIRNATLTEMDDAAQAIGSLDQSYFNSGTVLGDGQFAWTNTSEFADMDEYDEPIRLYNNSYERGYDDSNLNN